MLEDYEYVVTNLEDLDAMCSEAFSLQKSDLHNIKGRLRGIVEVIEKIKVEENDSIRDASNTQARSLLEEAITKVTKLSTTAECQQKADGNKTFKSPDFERSGTKDQYELHRRINIESTILKPGKVKFSDVAGLDNAKQHLREAIVLPLRFPHLFKGKRKSWTRILVYGPPGTGKSFLARAVSSEINATFYSVSSSDLLSSWFGESERLIKELFTQASAQEHSVIFIDEIDSLCRKRDSREDDQVRRIKTELLKQMEGADSGKSSSVFMLCATNCPNELDTAFLRRFQKRIYIPLPDQNARKKLIELSLVNSSHSLTTSEWDILLKEADGYSGSDISTCVADALLEPIREIDTTKFWKWSEDKLYITPCLGNDAEKVQFSEGSLPTEKIKPRPVSFQDLRNAIKNNPRTVSSSEVERYRKHCKDDITVRLPTMYRKSLQLHTELGKRRPKIGTLLKLV